MAITTASRFGTQALKDLLRQVLSLRSEQVRDADQPVPTDKIPWITVRLLTSIEIGQARRDFDGGPETERVVSSCISTYSMNAYGTDANDQIRKLRTALQTSYALDAMRRMSAGIVSFSPVRNLSAAVGAGYEERAQLDLNISHEDIVQSSAQRVEIANIVAKTDKITETIVVDAHSGDLRDINITPR